MEYFLNPWVVCLFTPTNETPNNPIVTPGKLDYKSNLFAILGR